MVDRRYLSGAIGGLLLALAAVNPAAAQKTGGILQMLDFASPASMSIHEESTITAGIPMMGVFDKPGRLRSARAAKQHRLDRPRSCRKLVDERGRHGAEFQASPQRQMA